MPVAANLLYVRLLVRVLRETLRRGGSEEGEFFFLLVFARSVGVAFIQTISCAGKPKEEPLSTHTRIRTHATSIVQVF